MTHGKNLYKTNARLDTYDEMLLHKLSTLSLCTATHGPMCWLKSTKQLMTTIRYDIPSINRPLMIKLTAIQLNSTARHTDTDTTQTTK